MQVLSLHNGPLRQAPIPNGPTASVLIDQQSGGGQLGAAYLTLPPGCGMPEHRHGQSATLLIVRHGELSVVAGERTETANPDTLLLIEQGEPVRLSNAGDEPVRALVVFAPPDFVRAIAGWPVAEAPTA